MSQVRLTSILASLESGSRPKGGVDGYSDGVPSLGGEHLGSDGGFRFENLKRVPREFFDQMDKGKLAIHDILVVKDGATTGKASLVRPSFPYAEAAINEHVFLLRLDDKLADARYVFYYLFSPLGQRQILADYRGATVGGISRSFTDGVILPLPPLPEQRRVADILDKADGIRRKRWEVCLHAGPLGNGLFQDIFGVGFLHSRSTIQLGSLVEPERGISYGVVQRGLDDPKGVPIVRISNIVRNRFDGTEVVRVEPSISDQYRRTVLRGGEVLVSIRGTVGRVAVAPDEVAGWNVSREIAVVPLRPNIPSRYIQELLLAPQSQRFIQGNVKGVAQRGINLSDLRELPVPDPSSPEVALFLLRIAKFDRISERFRWAVGESDLLFKSFVQRAFRGEL